MFRSLYFHSSEKDKNIEKLEEKLRTIKYDENNLTYYFKPHFKLNLGFIGDNYSFRLNTNINKYFKASKEKFYYDEKINDLNLNTKLNFKNIIFDNNIYLAYLNQHLKLDNNEFLYDSLDLESRTYLGFQSKASDKIQLSIGVNHLFLYGYIMPKK